MGKNSIMYVCVYISACLYWCMPLMCGYNSIAKIFLLMGNCAGQLLWAANLGASWLLLSMKSRN